MHLLARLALTGAVIASSACGGTRHETPVTPTPTLTASAVAPSLAAEINTSFKAALRAGLTAQGDLFASCSRGGNIRVTNFVAFGERVEMSSAIVSVTACGHSLNGRDVLASGPLTANGVWTASAPDSPVRLAGDLNVPDLGVITLVGTAGASFSGTVGGIAIGGVPPPTTTAPTTSTTTTTIPSGGGNVNVAGTWTVPGQPGALVITQNGSTLTCTVTGLPAGTTQNSCSGSVNGSTVNLTQTMTTVTVAGPHTATCLSNNALFATAAGSTMSGTLTRTGSCTMSGPVPLPPAPTVPTVSSPVVFVK